MERSIRYLMGFVAFIGLALISGCNKADQICQIDNGCINTIFAELINALKEDSSVISLSDIEPEAVRVFFLPRYDLLNEGQKTVYSEIIELSGGELKLFDSCSYILFYKPRKTTYILSECDPFWIEEVWRHRVNVLQPYIQIASPESIENSAVYDQIIELPLTATINNIYLIVVE